MKRLLLLLTAVVTLLAPPASATPASATATPGGWSKLTADSDVKLDHPVAQDARKRAGSARRARRGKVVRRLPTRFRPGRFVARPGLVPALGAASPAGGVLDVPGTGAALPLPAPVAGPTATATPDPGPEVPDLPDASERSVAVVSREWSFTLSQPSVKAGRVRVEFDNSRAQDAHELETRGADLAFGDTKAGARQVKTFTLSAGSYVLFCPLPQHEALGMKTTLVVRP